MSAAEGSAGTARSNATGADSTAGGILAAMGRRFRPRLPAWLMGWSHILRTLLAFSIALYAAYALELDSPSSAGLTVLIVASASRGGSGGALGRTIFFGKRALACLSRTRRA